MILYIDSDNVTVTESRRQYETIITRRGELGEEGRNLQSL